VSRVAILAGGSDDLEALAEAESLGADTYLAGHLWTPHCGRWPDANREKLRGALPSRRMNLLGASHEARSSSFSATASHRCSPAGTSR
jgi:hypothetical protein